MKGKKHKLTRTKDAGIQLKEFNFMNVYIFLLVFFLLNYWRSFQNLFFES